MISGSGLVSGDPTLLGLPNAEDGDNAVNRWFAYGAIIAAVLLIPAVIGVQQYLLWLREQTYAAPPAELATSEEVVEPGINHLTLAAQSMVKMNRLKEVIEDEDYEPPEAADLDELAPTRIDRLRVALVAGEIEGKEAALMRLKRLGDEATPNGALANELHWIRQIYEKGPDTIPEDVRQILVKRHGWFAELALAFKKPDNDPGRWKVLSGGRRLLDLYHNYFVFAGLSLLAGVICIVVFFSRGAGFESRFDDQAVGGPVYLESFSVFLAGFVILLCASAMLAWTLGPISPAALILGEVLLYGLALTTLWPWMRGIPLGDVAHDLGLHTGEGVLKEMGCGLVGFVLNSPLQVLLGIVWGIVVGSEDEASSSGFPLFDTPGSWTLVVLGVISAVIWAPVVEEIVFRGALYRAVNHKLPWYAAVLITALAFGLVHPYSPEGLAHVALSGIVFALLREWRGSLIAPITAHALHNGTISMLEIASINIING